MDYRLRPALSKQEAIRVGKLIVLAQHDQLALKYQEQRFHTKGYRVRETPHFVFCQKQSPHQTVLMHTFGQADIDADLICFIEKELDSFGFISSAKDFGAVLFAILASTFPSPRNQRIIWQRFCFNTLVKLREQIAHPLSTPPEVSYIAPFATIYRRIFDLCIGQSLLDIGCSFGFLPILMNERFPNMQTIMGCDNNPDALNFSMDTAEVASVRHVTFKLQDVLDATILSLGTFDTVTAIHLLEHLPEVQLAQAFEHLLKLTRHRLIVAVPYEQQVTTVYGHEQLFSREKLEKWGKWSIETLKSPVTYWCEDVAGGLLIVDRLS